MRNILIDIIGRDRASKAFETSAAASEAAARKMQGSAKKMTAVGATLSKAITLPVAAAVAVSITQAADFQKQQTLLQTAGGETVANMKVISSGIKTMAGDVGESLGNLSSGMYIVAKAGSKKWSATGQLVVLRAAAQGAKAENVDLATSTNALTSVMMSYHLGTSKAVATENELIVGAGKAKVTMSDYAGALSTVIPVASAAGIKFDQVAGAIATLTQHGTSADEATQELANALRGLQAPNSVAVQMMAQLGISAQDISSNLGKRGLTGTLTLLENKIAAQTSGGMVYLGTMKSLASGTQNLKAMTAAMNPELAKASNQFLAGTLSLTGYRKVYKGFGAEGASQGAAFASLAEKVRGYSDAVKNGTPAQQTMASVLQKIMGGATGLNTMLQLGGDNMAYFTQATNDVGAAGAKTGKNISTWAQTQNTLSVKTDQMKAKLQVLAVNLGTQLIPIASQVIGVISHVVTWFSHLSTGTQGTIIKVALLAAAIGPLLSILGRLYGTGKMLVVWSITAAQSMYRFAAGVRMAEISQDAMATKSYAAGLSLRTSLAGGAAEGGTALGALSVGTLGAAAGIAALGYGAYKLGQYLDKPSKTAAAFLGVLKSLKSVSEGLTNDLLPTAGALNKTTTASLALTLQQDGLAGRAAKSHISLTQLTAAVTGTDKQFNALVATWKKSGKPSGDTLVSLELMHGAFLKASEGAKTQAAQQAAAAKTAATLAGKTNASAAALSNLAVAAKAANVPMNANVDTVARIARDAGISAGAIDNMIRIMHLTPTSVSTAFNVDIQAALDRLAQLRAAIAATMAMQNDRNSPSLVAAQQQIAAIQKSIPSVQVKSGGSGSYSAPGPASGGGGSSGSSKTPFDKSTLSSFLSTATGAQSNPLTDALNAILSSAKSAGKSLSSSFVAALTKDNSKLKAEVAKRDGLATALTNAQNKLTSVMDLYNGEKSSVASAISGTFDVTNVHSAFGDQALSASDEVAAADKAAANATQFYGLLKTLTKEGLDKNIVAQLAAAGPGAMAAAKAFAAATPAQIAKENADYKTVATASAGAGTFMADQMYGAGVKSAQGLVNGLKSQQSALNKAITKLADGMIAALKKKLDIHSPSRVTHLIGQMTGLGMVHGMRSQIDAVNKESTNLARAAVPDNAPSDAARFGGRGSGLGDRPIVLKAYGPDARAVTREFEERLKSGRL